MSPGSSDRHSMVTVSNKIDLAYLDQFHRRQDDLVIMGLVNLEPAISGPLFPGIKSPVEFMK